MATVHSVYFNNRRLVITDHVSESLDRTQNMMIHYQGCDSLPKVLQIFKSALGWGDVFLIAPDVNVCFNDLRALFTPIDAAGGLVRNSHGQLLVIRRRGHWDLPKGKVEDGEALDVAALREVTEECGVTQLTISRHLVDTYHTYTLNGVSLLKRTVWYEMDCTDTTPLVPQQEEDITAALWVDSDKIPAMVSDSFGSVSEVFRVAGLIK